MSRCALADGDDAGMLNLIFAFLCHPGEGAVLGRGTVLVNSGIHFESEAFLSLDYYREIYSYFHIYTVRHLSG
jgi:hypothetical protein